MCVWWTGSWQDSWRVSCPFRASVFVACQSGERDEELGAENLLRKIEFVGDKKKGEVPKRMCANPEIGSQRKMSHP